jgi:hypothetical protein
VEPPPPRRISGEESRLRIQRLFGSPLVFDLNGDGVKTSQTTTRFDINADGQADSLNDISMDDVVLVFDADRNGIAGENAKELFGDHTDLSAFGIQGSFLDGFDALRALADHAKQSGLINQDDILDAQELATLEQEYGLKVKKGSLNAQAESLVPGGIQSINLSTGQKSLIENFDAQGNFIVNQTGALFTRTDGSQGTYADIFFRFI